MTLPGINWNTGSLTTSFKNDVGSDYLTPTFASGLPTLGNSSLLSQGSSAFEKAIPGLGGGNPLLGFDIPSEWSSVTDRHTDTPLLLKEQPIVDKDLLANNPFSYWDVVLGNPAFEINNYLLSTGLVFAGRTLTASVAAAAPSIFSGLGAMAAGAVAPFTAAVVL